MLEDEPVTSRAFLVGPEDFSLPPGELRSSLEDHSAPFVNLGSADQPGFDRSPPPALSLYLPQGWQHWDQCAPEDLKEGMRLHNVPTAADPNKNLTLRDVNYTATIGPAGLEHEIVLRRT